MRLLYDFSEEQHPPKACRQRICSSHSEMEEAIYKHFHDVFGQPATAGFTVDFHAIGIDPVDLDLPFSDEEVEVVVREMPADRAPGPDGFTGAFYKSTWGIIKADVVSTLNALFFGDNREFHRLNNAYVVLLPKKPDAATPADYRPITIIHSFGKLASKLMAIRLARNLGNSSPPTRTPSSRDVRYTTTSSTSNEQPCT